MSKEQKKYDKEFKINCVEYYLQSGKAASVIAEHFGINSKTFYSWIQAYKTDGQNSFKGNLDSIF